MYDILISTLTLFLLQIVFEWFSCEPLLKKLPLGKNIWKVLGEKLDSVHNWVLGFMTSRQAKKWGGRRKWKRKLKWFWPPSILHKWSLLQQLCYAHTLCPIQGLSCEPEPHWLQLAWECCFCVLSVHFVHLCLQIDCYQAFATYQVVLLTFKIAKFASPITILAKKENLTM